MKWLTKLFGGGKQQSKRRADGMTCDFCGTNIVPRQGGVSIGFDPCERMKYTGHYCSACNVVVCCPCSRKAASKFGTSHFVCPKCGSNVQDTMV